MTPHLTRRTALIGALTLPWTPALASCSPGGAPAPELSAGDRQLYPAFTGRRVAATNVYPQSRVHDPLFPLPSGRQGITTRTLHYLFAPVTELQVTQTVVSVYAPGPKLNPVTYACAVETADGTVVPFTWQRQARVSCQPGQVVTSDRLAVDLPKGYVWLRTYAHVDAPGQVVPLRPVKIGEQAQVGTASRYGGDTRNQGWDVDLTVPSAELVKPVLGGLGVGPAMLTTSADDVAIGLIGDSVAAGGGPDTLPPGYPTSSAFTLALHHSGKRFWTAATGATRASDVGEISALFAGNGGATHILCEMGLNSVRSGWPALGAENLALWQKLRSLGVQLFATTLTPFTTSKDGWKTNAGQKPDAACTAYNAWLRDGAPLDATALTLLPAGTSGAIRAGHAHHPLASTAAYPKGYVDVAATVESDPAKPVWDVDGKGKGRVLCDDMGLHPQAWVHDNLMRPAIEAWIATLTLA